MNGNTGHLCLLAKYHAWASSQLLNSITTQVNDQTYYDTIVRCSGQYGSTHAPNNCQHVHTSQRHAHGTRTRVCVLACSVDTVAFPLSAMFVRHGTCVALVTAYIAASISPLHVCQSNASKKKLRWRCSDAGCRFAAGLRSLWLWLWPHYCVVV